MEFPVCNLCNSASKRILYNNPSWLKVAGEQYKLVKCMNCGLIYLYPRPDSDEIDQFYEDIYPCYKHSISDETNKLIRIMRKRNLIRRRNFIESISGQTNGSILDVGCATGLFINEMKEAGWKVYGVEPISNAAEYARKEFGLDVFKGYFQEAPFKENSFDVITFWDVIEHTFSPREELAHAARLLKPGGILLVNIPNWESFDRRLFDSFWIGLDPPRHLYVFPRDVMNQMLIKAGLQIVDWRCLVPAYFSFIISVENWLKYEHPELTSIVSWLLNLPGMRFLFEPWYQVTNRLRKSGVISVIARKEIG